MNKLYNHEIILNHHIKLFATIKEILDDVILFNSITNEIVHNIMGQLTSLINIKYKNQKIISPSIKKKYYASFPNIGIITFLLCEIDNININFKNNIYKIIIGNQKYEINLNNLLDIRTIFIAINKNIKKNINLLELGLKNYKNIQNQFIN